MDFALGQFDLMEKIGQIVDNIRHKKKFGRSLRNLSHINRIISVDLGDPRFSIHPLFMKCYCLDDGFEASTPFIPGQMYQMDDDDVPEDLFGGPTTSNHPDEDFRQNPFEDLGGW